MPGNRVSNPYSTGGGGTNFELEVGALYLAALLTEEIPAGVQGVKVEKVQFQALHTGTLVDDIVITLNDDKRQRIIAYQIKHRLTFSKSDNTFKDIIKDCWKTFAGQTKFSFNSETDMLGIGIGIYSQKLDEHRIHDHMIQNNPYHIFLNETPVSFSVVSKIDQISTPSFPFIPYLSRSVLP